MAVGVYLVNMKTKRSLVPSRYMNVSPHMNEHFRPDWYLLLTNEVVSTPLLCQPLFRIRWTRRCRC